eukprot:Hpha_TRINITY_DN16171_c3_g7::TRINITY_DN16171_c3_g7_i3::g.7652::m.7652
MLRRLLPVLRKTDRQGPLGLAKWDASVYSPPDPGEDHLENGEHGADKRSHRTVDSLMSQICTGASPALGQWCHKVGWATTDICARCNNAADTAHHLVYDCAALKDQRAIKYRN